MQAKKHIGIAILGLLCGALLLGGTLFLELRQNPPLRAAADNFHEEIQILEGRDDAVVKNEQERLLLTTGPAARLTLGIWDNALARFAPESEAALRIVHDKAPRRVEFELDRGRVWINTRNSATTVHLTAGTTTLELEPGVFDIQYEKGVIIAVAMRRSLTATIAGRKIILPERRQIVISESKVARQAKTISQLRYSKLLKEYPFYAADIDEWIEKNQSDDRAFYRAYQAQMDERLRQAGPHLGLDSESLSFKVNRTWNSAVAGLTLAPQRKAERNVASAFDYFDAGLFADLIGKRDIAQQRYTTFQRIVPQADAELVRAAAYLRFDQIAHINPSSQLFTAQLVIRDLLQKSTLEKIHASFIDVLDAHAEGIDLDVQQNVVNLLNRFATLSDSSLQSVTDAALAEDILFEYIQLEDFIKRDDRFIRQEYLKILALLERAYLQVIDHKEEAQEQRQFFIQEKLKRIAKIQKKIERDELPFQQARQSILLLFTQIDELRPVVSDKAVLSFFDDELKKLLPLVTFLRSNSADNVQNNFAIHYETYRNRLNEAKEVRSLLESSVGGEEISPFRREELASLVVSALREVGIREVDINFPDDETSATVMITNAKFEGAEFSALYNTERRLFTNIIFNGEEIPNAVKLENVRVVFLVKLGKLELPQEVSEESLTEKPSQQSVLEKVALAQVKEALERLAITVEDKYIGLEDVANEIVHVRLATYGQGSEAVVFAFDIGTKSKRVENLVVQTVGGEVAANDSFKVDDLPTRVQQIAQRAIFEKEREAELKALIDDEPQPEPDQQ
ncbi:hypothetical protein COV82_02860 [Candidatus Peregrinibacteria bacterium CG11_big_fil_rev_8_21_14_0_20_46_8]|nr:MAG: hypothetical protein COV82_02860 [Candidatus Peregrinibacteria bacterium CG11_big_fil_rev_8_21_14_0_20_46_8]